MHRFALPAALLTLTALLAACQPKPAERTAMTKPADPCRGKAPPNPKRSQQWNDLRAQMECANMEDTPSSPPAGTADDAPEPKPR